ncbi:MAG: metal-dependent hydrolase [Gemmatimonadota bacterium]
MASAFSHAIVGLGIGACVLPARTPRSVWVTGALCSIVPDLDVIGFRFGIHYGDLLGHRGLTHSIAFAVLLSLLVVALVFPRGAGPLSTSALRVYLFLAIASHGVLDAFTDGGLGVAFFAPFENGRYFFPWRPVRVSPIGIGPFFSAHGLAILGSEIRWIWLPTSVLVLIVFSLRRMRANDPADR